MAAKKKQTKPKPKPKPKPKVTTFDGYLGALDDETRAALQRVRTIVHSAAPGAEECISYQIPAFRRDGRCFLWIGAAATHCALYGVLGTSGPEFADYDTSGRGTLRFTVDKPLPAALIRKLVKARLAQGPRR